MKTPTISCGEGSNLPLVPVAVSASVLGEGRYSLLNHQAMLIPIRKLLPQFFPHHRQEAELTLAAAPGSHLFLGVSLPGFPKSLLPLTDKLLLDLCELCAVTPSYNTPALVT